VMAPGMSDLTHLEQDVAILERDPLTLTPQEEAEVERWRQLTDPQSCHICIEKCQAVCEAKIVIDWHLYHNTYQNELRRLGVDGFMQYPFSAWVKRDAEKTFQRTHDNLKSCTQCGKCEEVCPYHLPILDMLRQITEQQEDLLEALKEAGWSTEFQNALSPLPSNFWSKRRTIKPKK